MDSKAIAIGGGIIALVVLVVLWQARKDTIAIGGAVIDGAKATAHAINPLNPDNAAASTVNAIGTAISGQPSWSLGAWVYDSTHSTTAP